MKVDKEATRATGEKFVYLFKVKDAADVAGKLNCTVDRGTETVTSVAAAE